MTEEFLYSALIVLTVLLILGLGIKLGDMERRIESLESKSLEYRPWGWQYSKLTQDMIDDAGACDFGDPKAWNDTGE